MFQYIPNCMKVMHILIEGPLKYLTGLGLLLEKVMGLLGYLLVSTQTLTIMTVVLKGTTY